MVREQIPDRASQKLSTSLDACYADVRLFGIPNRVVVASLKVLV